MARYWGWVSVWTYQKMKWQYMSSEAIQVLICTLTCYYIPFPIFCIYSNGSKMKTYVHCSRTHQVIYESLFDVEILT